jgi:hypothetical protein
MFADARCASRLPGIAAAIGALLDFFGGSAQASDQFRIGVAGLKARSRDRQHVDAAANQGHRALDHPLRSFLIVFPIDMVRCGLMLTSNGRLTMPRFIAGIVIGLVLGVAATSYAAGIFGEGTLSGWSVTKDGEEVCSDPSVDTSAKEIECD